MICEGPATAKPDLIRRAQGSGPGAREAKELIFSAYQPLLTKHTLTAPVPLQDDAYQAASEGLLKAIRACDPDRESTFGAFAKRYVRGAVLDEIAFHCNAGYVVEADLPAGPDDDDEPPGGAGAVLSNIGAEDHALELAEMYEVLIEIRGFVWGLPEVQRRVVVEVYYRDRTQAGFARELGVSRAAVNQTLAKVLIKARKEVTLSDN